VDEAIRAAIRRRRQLTLVEATDLLVAEGAKGKLRSTHKWPKTSRVTSSGGLGFLGTR
jgi:hypothetical protein